MSQEQYYAILAEKWAQVDKNSLEEIKEYNRWKTMMRSLMEWED